MRNRTRDNENPTRLRQVTGFTAVGIPKHVDPETGLPQHPDARPDCEACEGDGFLVIDIDGHIRRVWCPDCVEPGNIVVGDDHD